jgi:hypothetical protein
LLALLLVGCTPHGIHDTGGGGPGHGNGGGGGSGGNGGGGNGGGGGSGGNGGGGGSGLGGGGGSGGGGGGGDGTMDMAQQPPPGVPITTPNPIISRGRPLTSSSGMSSTIDGSVTPLGTLNDGAFWAGDGFAGGAGAWVAMDLGSGPTRILVTWLSLGNVDTPMNQPVDYHLDVSPDGNAWHTAVSITGNDTDAREHSLDFSGQRFVRLTIDRTDASGQAHLNELEVYDVSAGSDDTWMVLGDSISAMSLNRWLMPDVGTVAHQANARYFPMLIDQAIGGTNTTTALPRIDAWIARFPDVRNFIVAYGTNDGVCEPGSAAVTTYAANLGMIVDKLQAAGKRVAIPHIPWDAQCKGQPAPLGPFNDAIDTLRAQKQFIAGPDLYDYFAAHQDQLGPDHEHPNDAGQEAVTHQWAATIASLYQ